MIFKDSIAGPARPRGRTGRFEKAFIVAAVLLAAIFLTPAPGAFAADDGTRSPRLLTLDEAYSLAMTAHESVRIAGEAVLQAESGVSMATSAMLPQLSAEGAYTRYGEQKRSGGFLVQPDDVRTVDVRLSQTLFAGGTKWSARKQAVTSLEKSRKGYDFTREDVVLATADAYYGLLKSSKDIEIKEAALKRAEERKKVATARFRVGEVVKSAVLRAEAEVAGAEAELIKARSSRRDAENLLKRILGITGDIVVAEPSPANEIVESEDELVRMAVERRLDYRQSVLDREIAQEGIREARGNFLPSLSIQGAYSWKDQSPKTTFFQQESSSASLVLSYPIFEGGLRKAELSEAKSKLREAELRALSKRRDIELEVREAYNNLESSKALTESFKKQFSFAKEDYKMVFEQFKHGLATTVDVIDSDAELVSAESSLINARYDQRLATLKLRFASGTLIQDVIGK